MGVHGLWRLIEPSGKPVPLETLENKVLAVDVSIWLHQAIKGFQDSKGAPLPNAHLIGIYHRVCKLLYFRIKPVFVFDGGVPALKKETITKRNQQKAKTISETDRLQKQLLETLLKHSAVSKVLSEQAKASINNIATTKAPRDEKDELYVLPPSQMDSTISSEDEETEFSQYTSETSDSSPTKVPLDLHTIDMTSKHFTSLPADVRHEILTDLKETRKQSSWGRLHELPKQSDDFSSYQMNRLLKRQAVQTALEEAEKEMGGHSLSLGELESMLKDQGVITNNEVGGRIASDENTRYLFIADVKKAMERAKKQLDEVADSDLDDEQEGGDSVKTNKADLEFEEDMKLAIELSLQGEPSTSSQSSSNAQSSASLKEYSTNRGLSQFSFLEGVTDVDFQSDSSEEFEETTKPAKNVLNTLQNYMLEYSGLTPHEIEKIMGNQKRKTAQNKISKLVKNTESNYNFLQDTVEKDSFGINPIISVEKSGDEKDTSAEGIHINGRINVVSNNATEDLNQSSSIPSYVETPNKDNHLEEHDRVEIMSSSDESDFVEVADENNEPQNVKKHTGSSLEIVIEPTTTLEDDLFSDIFDNPKPKRSEKPQKTVKFAEQLEEVREIREENNEGVPPKPISEQPHKDHVIETDTASRVPKPKLSVEQMQEMKDNLRKEQIELLVEKSSKERLAGNITDQMYQEAQELLQLFGVPYVVAPMEAEAQCAFLDEVELTDGTITDDSDIWLFGGRTVYKNFFNQSKYVMEFKSENIQHNFKLNRYQMILLALLVGSDYTTGIQGVGPVTALEILAAFPPHGQLISGLTEFRNWFKKGKTPGVGRTVLKNKLKNVCLSENFPSMHVVQAYLEPTVERSREGFTWGKPDIVGLVDFAKEKFGWTTNKTQEIIKPVVKRLEESHSQKKIKDYFKSTFKVDAGIPEGKLSKRVKTAISRMGPGFVKKRRRNKRLPKEEAELSENSD